jgi:hypothetical protein
VGLLILGRICDERMVPLFTVGAGPRQHIPPRVPYPAELMTILHYLKQIFQVKVKDKTIL